MFIFHLASAVQIFSSKEDCHSKNLIIMILRIDQKPLLRFPNKSSLEAKDGRQLIWEQAQHTIQSNLQRTIKRNQHAY